MLLLLFVVVIVIVTLLLLLLFCCCCCCYCNVVVVVVVVQTLLLLVLLKSPSAVENPVTKMAQPMSQVSNMLQLCVYVCFSRLFSVCVLCCAVPLATMSAQRPHWHALFQALTGVIFPPSEIRTIVDKTAKMVAQLGAEFESKIMREAARFGVFRFFLSCCILARSWIYHRTNVVVFTLVYGAVANPTATTTPPPPRPTDRLTDRPTDPTAQNSRSS